MLLVALVVMPMSFGQAPKREFRAVWVATVANIDWPSRPGLSSEQQRSEITSILDMHKENGMNAIILQVRPTADAMYASELEPWSRFLTGEQGRAPEPLYDPLEYWIGECHRRGMELHAWFNPYRIALDTAPALDSTHMALKNPDWTFTYGGRKYYKPSDPRVWSFVSEVVVDVVRRYDVDAVHFDDYFYPYYVAGESLNDSLDFMLLGGRHYPGHIDDWRRNNVDTIIQSLHQAIKAEKPWVKFGISPFGVWRNRDRDPRGSETQAGSSNYDGLYADVLRWQREGWIDYLMPQLYWRDDHPAAGFSTLAYWWNDFSYGRSMYVGLAPYRIDRKSMHRMWRRDKYLLQQMDLLRQLEGIHGFGFFSSKHFFRKDLSGLNRKLRKRSCPYPALVPPMPWIDAEAPAAPSGLHVDGDQICWEPDSSSLEMNRSRFYVLYHYPKGSNTSSRSPGNMVALTGEHCWSAGGNIPAGTYRLSALDRLNNESQLSPPLEIGRGRKGR